MLNFKLFYCLILHLCDVVSDDLMNSIANDGFSGTYDHSRNGVHSTENTVNIFFVIKYS
jgi:hypothetical protein